MKTLHIFKPGTHQPMQGAALSFGEADLAASARAYDPDIHEAPIVIGHPSHDAPAHGWVAALKTDSTGLRAVTRQVNPAFAEIVRGGAYKKISASFYAPDAPNNPVPGVYYLRHVGFLGAQPPAVKGLEKIDLAEAEDGVICFEENVEAAPAQAGKSLFQQLHGWLAKHLGQESADKVLPQDKLALLDGDAGPADPQSPPVSEDAPAETLVTELAQRVADQAEELKALRAQDEARQAEAGKATREEAAAFAERLIRDGRLLPRHRGAVVAFMEAAAGRPQRGKTGVLMFGEGEDERALLPAFKSFLSSLPRAVDFSEKAVRGRAAAPAGAVNPLVADAERRAGVQK